MVQAPACIGQPELSLQKFFSRRRQSSCFRYPLPAVQEYTKAFPDEQSVFLFLLSRWMTEHSGNPGSISLRLPHSGGLYIQLTDRTMFGHPPWFLHSLLHETET